MFPGPAMDDFLCEISNASNFFVFGSYAIILGNVSVLHLKRSKMKRFCQYNFGG